MEQGKEQEQDHNLFKHTIYINLESRKDRKLHVLNELAHIGITDAICFSAITLKSAHKTGCEGAAGCSMSHMKCLQIAKTNKWPHVFICEDDFTCINRDQLKKTMATFAKEMPLNEWDVLFVGGNVLPDKFNPPRNNQHIIRFLPNKKTSCVRTRNCQTTIGYIVNESMYDILIENIKSGLSMLLEFPRLKNLYAIDMYYKQLQNEYRWFILTPLTVTQWDNYSDIEEKNVNYDNLMLTTADEKAAMFAWN